MVERGLGASGRRGEVTHVHASTCRPRLTLDDLPELLDRTKAELVILDSLTGLRPRQIRGRDVRWDVDNDATEELTSGLRALTTERGVPLILVHHTGREVAKGYRGPTAWWAAADVQIGLEPDTLTGTIKVTTEKSRDSGRLVPFRIRPEWTPEGFRIEYQGETVAKPLGHIARQVLAFLKGRGPTVQSEITKLLGFKRQRVSVAVKELIEAELVMYGQQIDARTPTLVLVEDCPDCPNSEADNPLE
jgi:hypothetical protein